MLSRRDFLKAGLFAGAAIVLPQATRASSMPSILWMGWDGADYRTITNLLAAGQLPNLGRLHTVRLDCAGCTQTKPGWVEIVNGLEYSQTGVYTNKRYKEVAREKTLFWRLKKSLPSYWCGCVLSKKNHTGDGPGEPWRPVRPWALAGGLDYYCSARQVGHNLSIAETNYCLGEMLSRLRAPGLIFCHYARPDRSGHESGMDSPEYQADILALDEALGWAMSAMQPEVVIVCSDHGFNHSGARAHTDAPDGFISSTLALRDEGVRRDVGYTVARILGLPLESWSPPLRGKDLRL